MGGASSAGSFSAAGAPSVAAICLRSAGPTPTPGPSKVPAASAPTPAPGSVTGTDSSETIAPAGASASSAGASPAVSPTPAPDNSPVAGTLAIASISTPAEVSPSLGWTSSSGGGAK